MHSPRILSFLIILLSTAVARKSTTQYTPCAFASCPPPRFDNFLDSIIGRWSNVRTSDGKSITSNISTASSVEEVMRSCGGAVQGVKEIEFTGSLFDQMYHNRADDGFVYFDCGSYSAGPTSIPNSDSDGSDGSDENGEYSLVSNLSFATALATIPTTTIPKSRIIVTTTPNFSLSLVKTKTGEEVSGNIDHDHDENSNDTNSENNIIDLLDQPPSSSIRWSQEVLCRMSSPSQPWMLQRATWEKFIHGNIDQEEDEVSDDIAMDSKIESSWISSCHISSLDEETELSTRKQLWQSEGLSSFFRSNSVSRIIQVGAMADNHNVKAFLRCYNNDGNLRAVVMQSGKCV
jgi:hypothetical protein